MDILRVFQLLDSTGKEVVFSCDSISMRTVKVSTMLFSDEEPIVAQKLAVMDKTISEILSSQKTLFTLIGEKLDNTSSGSERQTPGVGSGSASAPVTSCPVLATSGPTAATSGQGLSMSFAQIAAKPPQRGLSIQPRSKRLNSLVAEEALELSDDDVWEISAEEKRKEKLRRSAED